MTFQARAGFRGLVTATSETGADKGALRVCDNFVLRKDGQLTARPGFVPLALGYTPAGAVLAAHAFGTATLYEQADGVRNTAGVLLQAPNVSGGPTTPTRLRADIFDAAVSRGTFYFPARDGVYKLSAPSDTVWQRAGLFISDLVVEPVFASGYSTATLPGGYQFAYRVVMKKTDANGAVIRSRPTGAITISNPAGQSATAPGLRIKALRPALFDEVEIYRSRTYPNGNAIDDELQLVGTVPASLLSASTPYTWADHVAETSRGATLYTSPSRGGMENANDPPPAAGLIELFRGATFYANLVGVQRFVFSYPWSLITTHAPTVFGTRSGLASAANGSTTLSDVSMALVASLESGMVARTQVSSALADPGAWIVQNPGDGTLVLNRAATATSAYTSVMFHEAVQINEGPWHRLSEIVYASGTSTIASPVTGWTVNSSLQANTDTAGLFGSYTITPAVTGSQATVVIESIARNAAPFTVRVTHGHLLTPALPRYGEATTTVGTSKMDTSPSGIMWSDIDQPENVPPKNFAFVGEATKHILALATTRDALFILKEDGIWRLTGTNGAWRIDPFDMTTFCLLPSSVRKFDGRIYMLSNKGVVAIDDSGVEVVSLPVRDQIARVVDHVRAQFASAGVYRYAVNTGLTGTLAAQDDRSGEYVLALPAPSVPFDTGGHALVWNAQTAAWSTFSFATGTDALTFTPSGWGVAANGSVLLFHAGGVRVADYGTTTIAGASFLNAYDGASAALMLTLGNVDATGAAGYAYTPGALLRVGDVLVAGGEAARVIEVLSATSIRVDRVLPSLSAVAYRAIVCLAEPQGFSSPEETGKAWSHVVWSLSRLSGTASASARFTSATPVIDLSAQLVSEALPLPAQLGVVRHEAGTLLRANVPLAHRRGWLLRAGLEVRLAHGTVQLERVSADAADTLAQRSPLHSTGAG